MASEKVLIMVVLAAMLVSTQGQNQMNLPCVQALMPCMPFTNATTAPPSCCEPLKQVLDTMMPCLCTVLHQPNVDINRAIEFPAKCGLTINRDPSVCNKGNGAQPTSAPSTLNSTTSSPGSGSSSASSVTLAGPISKLMLLAGLLVFY